jgi:hypothetical protein
LPSRPETAGRRPARQAPQLSAAPAGLLESRVAFQGG